MMGSPIDALLASAKSAIVTVGYGRGFVVETHRSRRRLVITAGHCLPYLPPSSAGPYTENRTLFSNLLGPLALTRHVPEELTVGADCLFVDPISDLAVLCEPDDPELYEEDKEYKHLVDERPALRIGSLSAGAACPGWVLTLEGRWERCEIDVPGGAAFGHRLACFDVRIEAGMSGSPIVDDAGRAVGVVSVESTLFEGGEVVSALARPPAAMQPVLTKTLPAWLVDELASG